MLVPANGINQLVNDLAVGNRPVPLVCVGANYFSAMALHQVYVCKSVEVAFPME